MASRRTVEQTNWIETTAQLGYNDAQMLATNENSILCVLQQLLNEKPIEKEAKESGMNINCM